MIFANLKAYGWMAAAIAAGGLLLVQTFRLHGEQIAHQKLKTEVAQASLDRSEAVRTDELKTSSKESSHATSTLEVTHAFTKDAPVRAADHAADIAAVERMRIDAERRAATYRAQADANSTACRNFADRLTALDGHIVSGGSVVAELKAVVAKRDAEVVLLRGQIDADRALLLHEAWPQK